MPRTSRKLAILSLTLQFLSLTGAIGLIGLNWHTMYIGVVSASVSTAIQFAAKSMEILLQFSLTVILLDIVKRMAASAQPIPLGSFLAPYRLTDLSYLWSDEYWGAVTSKHLCKLCKVVVVLCIPVMALLAVLIGPSTAIAMIPRLIQSPVAQNLIFLGTTDALYPKELSTINGSISNEASIIPSLYGLSFGQRLQPGQSGIIADTQGTRAIRNSMNMSADGWLWNTSTTIPTQGSSSVLLGEGGVGNSNTALVAARQPWVNGTCAMYSNGKKTKTDLASGYVRFSNTSESLNGLVRYQDLFMGSSNSTLETTSRLAVLQSETVNASLGWYDASNVTNDNKLLMAYAEFCDSASEPGTDPVTIACLMQAWWIEAYLNMTNPSPVVDGNVQLNDPKHSPLEPILIHPQWMKRIAQLFLEANLGLSEMADITPGDLIVALAISNAAQLPCQEALCLLQTRPRRVPLAFLMDKSESEYDTVLDAQQNASMTQFLATNGNAGKYKRIIIWPRDGWSNVSALTQYEINHVAMGYGYDTSTIPVKLSLAALLLYSVIVMAYIVYSLSSGYTSSSWDSIGEILMLGLHSKHPEYMKGTSTETNTINPYKRPMNVRIGPEGRAEILFADDTAANHADYSQVMYNKKYF